jgi:hypothetical protein
MRSGIFQITTKTIALVFTSSSGLQWIIPYTAQTTIESVDLTYDDANCVSTASQASASDTSNDTTNSAQLAATGTNTDSINLIATTLLITSATTFVMKRKASL